jgi:ATP-dependent Clp protease ATP-binding subunit ClpA
MFERFTPAARRAMVLSIDNARALRHNFIGTEHVLLGVLSGDGFGAEALARCGVTHGRVSELVEGTAGPPDLEVLDKPPFTPRTKTVLTHAARQAGGLGDDFIGTEHLVLGLMSEGEGIAARVLTGFGVTSEHLRDAVQAVRLEDRVRSLEHDGGEGDLGGAPPHGERPTPSAPGATSREEDAAAHAVAAAVDGAVGATAGLPVGPRCAGCDADLVESLCHALVEASAAAPAGRSAADTPPRPVTVVFCGTCGRTLGVIPD